MSKPKDKEYAPEFDPTSSSFDPLKALYAPIEQVYVPVPNARLYDNIYCFEEREDGIFPREVKKRAEKQEQKSQVQVPPLSQFHNVQTKPIKETKNVITRMDDQETKDPLYFLKKCMLEKQRVKVVIRNHNKIRGHCIGFIEAFDKHMNIVLKDVNDIWKRSRKKTKMYNNDIAEPVLVSDSEDENEKPIMVGVTLIHKHGESKHANTTENCYGIPRWLRRRRLKKQDICERHIDQMMIRGEQIITVTKADTSSSSLKS